MNWLTIVVSSLSAVAGGFIGGWVVAYRIGRWRENVEGRLAAAEARLERGDPHVGKVPILRERLEVVIAGLEEIKRNMREGFKKFQTKEVCEERHGRTQT